MWCRAVSVPRQCGQRREKNSPEREVMNGPNNCHDKRKRVWARLTLACPGWTINRPSLLAWTAAQRKAGSESLWRKRARNWKASGCKQIWQDCKASDVGLGMGEDIINLLGFNACCEKGGWECGILQMGEQKILCGNSRWWGKKKKEGKKRKKVYKKIFKEEKIKPLLTIFKISCFSIHKELQDAR